MQKYLASGFFQNKKASFPKKLFRIYASFLHLAKDLDSSKNERFNKIVHFSKSLAHIRNPSATKITTGRAALIWADPGEMAIINRRIFCCRWNFLYELYSRSRTGLTVMKIFKRQ